MHFVELFIIEKLFNDFVIKFECDIELFPTISQVLIIKISIT